MEGRPCPFCAQLSVGTGLVAGTELSAALPDGFPLSDGHVLVVPRRHATTPFDLAPEEWNDLFGLVRRVAGELIARLSPDGVNVGFNAGAAAGQTVEHAHVHVIPRRAGDHPDPRGGVRWVLPERAAYWGQA